MGLGQQLAGQHRTSAGTSARGITGCSGEVPHSGPTVTIPPPENQLTAKPLIVVTAGSGHNAEWMPAQDRPGALSTNSEHRVVADATHESLLLVPTDGAAATKAIRDVVMSVRTSSPLN